MRDEFTISYGFGKSPFGWCLIGDARGKICHLSFTDVKNEGSARRIIKSEWPAARLARDDARAGFFAEKIFSGSRGDGKRKKIKPRIPLMLRGTSFQMKVWKALLAIPEGKTATYADIARAAGSPKAFRAAGAACGKNAIAFLIPCHRVLASSGAVGGYRWGIRRKQAMLAREAAKK